MAVRFTFETKTKAEVIVKKNGEMVWKGNATEAPKQNVTCVIDEVTEADEVSCQFVPKNTKIESLIGFIIEAIVIIFEYCNRDDTKKLTSSMRGIDIIVHFAVDEVVRSVCIEYGSRKIKGATFDLELDMPIVKDNVANIHYEVDRKQYEKAIKRRGPLLMASFSLLLMPIVALGIIGLVDARIIMGAVCLCIVIIGEILALCFTRKEQRQWSSIYEALNEKISRGDGSIG